jgi:hypothetical protein
LTYSPAEPGHSTGRNLLSVLLAVAVAFLLVSLSLAQLTAETQAKRSLARSIAMLTEIDAFVDDNGEALRREAEASGGTPVVVAGFPIEIQLQPDAVVNADQERLRALILERAAERVHDDGLSAFPAGGSASLSLSTREALENWMSLNRPGPHDILVVMAGVFSVITLLLAIANVLLSPLPRGLARVGLATVAGAAPVVLVAGFAVLAIEIGSDSSGYLTREYAELLKEAFWAPLRNGIVFLGAGAALFALGFVLGPRGTVDHARTFA